MFSRNSVQSIGAVVRNSLRMESAHFADDLSHPEAIRLFQDHVELIEVETTSYCNRVCSFCPNSFIDRRSETFTMPETAWQAIVNGLKEVKYDGTFVWSRYSEPLSERRIIQRIRELRRVNAKLRICINSNGDYLDANYLAELEDAGLNRLWIDIYIPDDEIYDIEVAQRSLERFSDRIERRCTVISTSPELSCTVPSATMEIGAHVRNNAAMKAMDLSDRGGLIQIARQTLRQAPCYAPFKHLVIDWDGSVVICCQLRSDSPGHKAGVIGKIGVDVGLVDAYVQLAEWRSSLRSYGQKRGPCATCNVSEYDSNAVTRNLSRFLVGLHPPIRAAARVPLRPLLRKRSRY